MRGCLCISVGAYSGSICLDGRELESQEMTRHVTQYPLLEGTLNEMSNLWLTERLMLMKLRRGIESDGRSSMLRMTWCCSRWRRSVMRDAEEDRLGSCTRFACISPRDRAQRLFSSFLKFSQKAHMTNSCVMFLTLPA